MSTLFRGNLPDLYLEDALPFLENVIQENLEQYPYVSEKVFNMGTMKHGIAQHSQVSALSPASEVAEGAEIGQDKIYQGFSTTYKAKKYGVLLATTQESIDHEKWSVLSKNPQRMARSVASTRETVAASVFNNGFATNGSDGVPLFSTAHPLLAPGAGTSSNLLGTPADLSATSLKDLITVMRKQLDTAGNKVMIQPKTLLVPVELEFVAYELLRSTYLPDTPNNNLSSVGPSGLYKIEPLSWNYLTDTDAFFLIGQDHEMHWFWDKMPEVKTQMEFKSDIALTRILTRFVCGYSDWRGVAASAGAP